MKTQVFGVNGDRITIRVNEGGYLNMTVRDSVPSKRKDKATAYMGVADAVALVTALEKAIEEARK